MLGQNKEIEFALPVVPETNKNRKSIKRPSQSMLQNKDYVHVDNVDDEEFPEVKVVELPSHPMTTEIADLTDLPKIKLPVI